VHASHGSPPTRARRLRVGVGALILADLGNPGPVTKVSGWFASAKAGPWSIDPAYGIWTDGGTHKAKPARVFRFEAIENAHRLIESNQANGKLVVAFEVSLNALNSEPPEEEYTNS
jgi:hypothetical protein